MWTRKSRSRNTLYKKGLVRWEPRRDWYGTIQRNIYYSSCFLSLYLSILLHAKYMGPALSGIRVSRQGVVGGPACVWRGSVGLRSLSTKKEKKNITLFITTVAYFKKKWVWVSIVGPHKLMECSTALILKTHHWRCLLMHTILTLVT